jgi:hypothetical protein
VIKLWLEKNKVIVMLLSALAMVALLAVASWQIVALISSGGRAIGREEKTEEIVEKIDEENAARRRVSDCLNARRVWNDALGVCGEPAVPPVSR